MHRAEAGPIYTGASQMRKLMQQRSRGEAGKLRSQGKSESESAGRRVIRGETEVRHFRSSGHSLGLRMQPPHVCTT